MSGLSEFEFSVLQAVVDRWDEVHGMPVLEREVERVTGLSKWEVQEALQGLSDRALITIVNYGDDQIMSVGSPTSDARALLR